MTDSVKPFKPEFTIAIFYPLQAANCCRNSRLVVDEDDLKRMANENNISLLLQEGFFNFKHQHCPHLVIFIIEYILI